MTFYLSENKIKLQFTLHARSVFFHSTSTLAPRAHTPTNLPFTNNGQQRG